MVITLGFLEGFVESKWMSTAIDHPDFPAVVRPTTPQSSVMTAPLVVG
jgi:hypothetical protein